MIPADLQLLQRQNAMALRAIIRLKERIVALEAERDTLRKQLQPQTGDTDDTQTERARD